MANVVAVVAQHQYQQMRLHQYTPFPLRGSKSELSNDDDCFQPLNMPLESPTSIQTVIIGTSKASTSCSG